jgi:hypothetical protein
MRVGMTKLHEEDTAVFGKRRMAETLRIEEIGAGRPMPVFVGKDAIENENLLSIRRVVRPESRAGS